MRAVLYARVSTARQAGAEHYSLPIQRELYATRCLERGYEAGGEYSDAETGRTASRRGYQQLLADARAGAFDVIVVRDITRFGRDADEITARTAELRGLGVTLDAVVSIVPEASAAGMSPQVLFLLRAVESFLAAQSSADTASRVTGTMRASAASGKWQGKTPFGYRLGPDGHLAIDPIEADVVRWIFEAFAVRNQSLREITRDLHGRGILSRAGALWWASMVRRVVTNRAYLGILSWADVEVRDAHAPLVSAELFAAAQTRLVVKRELPAARTQSSPYLLSGLVYCGNCGGRMSGRIRRSRWHYENGERTLRNVRVDDRHYACRLHISHGGCVLNRHRAGAVEATVLRDLASLLSSVSARRERLDVDAADVSARLDEARRELARVPARLRVNLQRREAGVFATDDQLREANQALEDDRRALSEQVSRLEAELARLDAARASSAISSSARPFTPEFEAMPLAERKAWIQGVIERVTLTPGAEPVVRLRV